MWVESKTINITLSVLHFSSVEKRSLETSSQEIFHYCVKLFSKEMIQRLQKIIKFSKHPNISCFLASHFPHKTSFSVSSRNIVLLLLFLFLSPIPPLVSLTSPHPLLGVDIEVGGASECLSSDAHSPWGCRNHVVVLRVQGDGGRVTHTAVVTRLETCQRKWRAIENWPLWFLIFLKELLM